MPIVKLPDGTLVDVPDEILNPGESGFLPTAKRTLGSAVAGFGKTAAGLARGAAVATNAFGGAQPGAEPDVTTGAPGNPAGNMLDRAASSAEDYWTEFGNRYGLKNRYGKAVVEGASGAALTPQQGLLGVVAGGGGGGGSEAAANAFGDNLASRLAGSVVGAAGAGSVAARTGRASSNLNRAASEITQELSPQQIEAAQNFMREAAKTGVQVDFAQALEATLGHGGNATVFRDLTAASAKGVETKKLLHNQSGQLDLKARLEEASLPGRNYGEGQAANNLQEAATRSVQAAKDQRSAAVKGLYEKVGPLPEGSLGKLTALAQKLASQPGTHPSVVEDLQAFSARMQDAVKKNIPAIKEQAASIQAQLDAEIAKAPSVGYSNYKTLEQLGKQLEDLRGQLGGMELGMDFGKLHAADVDTWLGSFAGKFKGTPISPADPKAAGQAKFAAKELNKAFQGLSPEVAAAEREFARQTREVVNPVKQSLTGQIATRGGYRDDVQASMSKFSQALEAGTDPNASTSQIKTLATQLHKTDPEAFQDAFKTWVSGKLAKAQGAAGTQTDKEFPDRLRKELFGEGGKGSKARWQGMQDALEIQARLNGQNGQEVVKGFKHLMQLTVAMKNRPDATSLSKEGAAEISKQSMAADALRTIGFMPVGGAARKLNMRVSEKTLSQLDRLLTTPEGIDTLAKLGKTPVVSKSSLTILQGFVNPMLREEGGDSAQIMPR